MKLPSALTRHHGNFKLRKMSNYLGAILVLVGIAIFLVGGLLFLIAAFRESIWWGLACLFLPIVQLFFLIVHWPEAKKPFFFQLLGFVVLLVGFLISPQTLHH